MWCGPGSNQGSQNIEYECITFLKRTAVAKMSLIKVTKKYSKI
jgi:hypothetical protein